MRNNKRYTMKYLYILLTLAVSVLTSCALFKQKPPPVKVACIGDSITYGAGISKRYRNSYPAQLQNMLDKRFIVKNFGVSGGTLLKKGNSPYWKENAYKKALEFTPDIVVIALGTNDTKPYNWKYGTEFDENLKELILSFKGNKSPPMIILCNPIPVQHDRWGISEKILKEEVEPQILRVAKELKVSYLDLRKALPADKKYYLDGIHPNKTGAELIASAVYRKIIGIPPPKKVNIASIFSDDMVLQRNKKVPIWGKASPGELITIEFNGQKKSVYTDKFGNWKLELDPMPTSRKGLTMRITGSGSKTILRGILIGEVWLCSGQSNMEWPLRKHIIGNEEAIKTANYPDIRFFKVGRQYSGTPEEECNGYWLKCTPYSAAHFSAVAFFFGKKIFTELKGVPIGLILSTWGGTSVISWTPESELNRLTSFKKKLKSPSILTQLSPGTLYNGMINPLVPFAIRGVIWYQGESDTSAPAPATRYIQLFTMMVQGWRKHFSQGNFPFYYVQIAPYNYSRLRTGAAIREAQRLCMQIIPNSGMVCLLDKGSLNSIHPPYKQEVGERLALWALAKNYDFNIEYSGPLFSGYETKNGKIIVHFKHAKGLTSQGLELTSFALKDNAGYWHKATAKIIGPTIELESKIPHPTAIRYAWTNTSSAVLWNDAGLPASSFRSDWNILIKRIEVHKK